MIHRTCGVNADAFRDSHSKSADVFGPIGAIGTIGTPGTGELSTAGRRATRPATCASRMAPRRARALRHDAAAPISVQSSRSQTTRVRGPCGPLGTRKRRINSATILILSYLSRQVEYYFYDMDQRIVIPGTRSLGEIKKKLRGRDWNRSMIPKSGYRFSERIMLQPRIEGDDNVP